MHNLILASLLLLAVGDFEARTVDGARVAGPLAALDGEHVTIHTSKGIRSLPVRELMSLAPVAPPRSIAAASLVVVELVDGSSFRAERFVVAGAQAEMTPSAGPAVCPIEKIRSVRFAEAVGPVLEEWKRLLGETTHTDVLVVGRGDVLDYHEGVIRGVSDDRVAMELGGKLLKVNRSKVFGLIYYHPSRSALPEAIAALADTRGSRWSVRSMSLGQDVLHVTTPAGVAVDCRLSDLQRLDFSAGKILYLGQLKPRSVRWTPYFGQPNETASRKAFFAPLHDPGLAGPPMLLGGRRFAQGIALTSRTELVYDLPEGYRRFQATVGIDDAFRPRGDAQLIIRAGDRTLLDTILTGTEPPRTIDLDVGAVERLTILVDFGHGMDLGDHVDLGEARLVK